MENKYVPEEIVVTIIAKLPAKPLFKFKCVSKHWNSLISDTNFLKSRSRRMIFLTDNPFCAIDNNVPVSDSANSILRLPSPCVEGKYVKVVGTINGIVLLAVCREQHYDRYDVILYNPLTAAILNVPRRPSHRPYNILLNVFGFGYGTTPDDLKIVIISPTQRCDLRYCDVFDFKTKSWSKPLELTGNYNFRPGCEGVFVNGYLYWNVSVFVTNENSIRIYEGTALVALDVKEMVFSEIRHSLPALAKYPLGTLKGRLCMICNGRNGDCLELWVMDGIGHPSSLSKISQLTSLYAFVTYRIMCILDDGKMVILMNCTNELMIYDMLNDSYNKVKTLEKKPVRLDAIEYVESCVSLPV